MNNDINLICKLTNLLYKLNQIKSDDFSGIGLVLYQEKSHLEAYHTDLIPYLPLIMPMRLGSLQLTNYLTKISSYYHPFHDGFHFINSEGILTHICQFFSPPINSHATNLKGQGARTLCALYGSKLKSVLMIGTISSKGNMHLFKNGKVIEPCLSSDNGLKTKE